MMRLEVARASKLFVPETWGEATRFQALHRGTYLLDDDTERALTGVTAHYGRCLMLTNLAKKLAPKGQAGQGKRRARGGADAALPEEASAAVETAILEMYSSVDCAAQVLRTIYGEEEARGARKLLGFFFRGARMRPGAFPESLKSFLQEALWFEDLCRIRDELVHAGLGVVHWDERDGSAEYANPEVLLDGETLVLEDVFGWLEEKRGELNEFLGEVFRQLNETLNDRPVKTPCGMVGERLLERWVNPADELTFDSGRCASWQWFERPENPTCPFKESCGAYRNKAPAGKAG